MNDVAGCTYRAQDLNLYLTCTHFILDPVIH